MKFHESCADTDVGVAVGSIGSEEKAGFTIHCHGVERTACPVGEQQRGGAVAQEFRNRGNPCGAIFHGTINIRWKRLLDL
jgi:hypothetical protein